MNAIEHTLLSFTGSIQPAKRAWTQAAATVMADESLTMSLAVVLVLVHRNPDVHQKMLADEVGVNPTAIVRLLDQGEAEGLLDRHDAPSDRRIKLVKLTRKGRQVAERLEKTASALRVNLLGDIPNADVETATRVLRLLEERSIRYLAEESPLVSTKS
ncbi:MarR family transcriptional regulator [Pandoraea terrae]|uniref:MarR family transcriptional regulator n=1 Tax=Pandoraea terrae TaxID=1537710 RepID=A0A5E4ZA67_9BURK|nr:MarR family transcriptional regulator [Pandoraea terrae]VVE57944.1 MarR family transcriptional regulator [Pandoraea terrae]